MANATWLEQNLKIVFIPNDDQDPARVTGPHERMFSDVRDIGRLSCAAYQPQIFLEIGLKPWRLDMKRRAHYIADRAKNCLSSKQNEPGWRMKVEEEVFRRFSIDVNCTTCRAELWHAVKDPTKDTPYEDTTKRCLCDHSYHSDPSDRNFSVNEGMGAFFGEKISAQMKHVESIETAHISHREPDRICGLQKTGRIFRLLDKTIARDNKLIGTSLTSSPYSDPRNPLIFPFLVSEAKAERSADSLSAAREQSAASIITCLELQAKLAAEVTSVKPDHPSLGLKPLVWFFCNKGEQWQIAVAWIRNPTGTRSIARYSVETLWTGNITHTDQALQMLLILDYAFDWARDVYRKNIIAQLLALAADPSPSVVADTEFLTAVVGQVPGALLDIGIASHGQDNLVERHLNFPQLLDIFDESTPYDAALRDGRFLVHEILGVDLTGDNWEEYLRAMNEHPSRDSFSAREIQKALLSEHAWIITADTLDELELLWTDKDREHIRELRRPDAKFIVNFAICSYFNVNVAADEEDEDSGSRWQQVHSLRFVAVAEDLMSKINEKVGALGRNVITSGLKVDKNEVLAFFLQLRHASARQCLSAALSSVEKITSWIPAKGDGFPKREQICLTDPGSEASIKELSETVYEKFRQGRRNPTESFLRYSRLMHEQLVINADTGDWLMDATTIGESDQIVFAIANVLDDNSESRWGLETSHCIFFVNPTSLASDLSSDPRLAQSYAQRAWGTQAGRQQRQHGLAVFRLASITTRHGRHTVPTKATDPESVTFRDFDWFAERIGLRWKGLSQILTRIDTGYDTSDYQDLIEAVKRRSGPTKDLTGDIQLFLVLGKAYGFQELVKYLRLLTNGPEVVNASEADEGADRSRGQDTDSVDSSSNGKRNQPPEDELDRPGPSKRARPSEHLVTPTRHDSVAQFCPTPEQADEDEIVRLSLQQQ